jgi:protocatechuate 3,4-dioxygenase beta subunit
MRLALLLLCLPGALSAQVVRGVVRDSVSGGPAAGVLVALLQRGTGERRTVLSDEEGRFTIAAPGAGSYSVETKRIGVRPLLSPEFTLSAGEARELSLTVAGVVAVLDVVRVTGRSYCGDRMTEGAETATLWQEVRAALIATRLTREGRGFPVTIASFKRTLDPTNFQVRAEERSERSGVTANPFVSVPLASLSAHGYVVGDGAGNLLYRGPDVDALLSDAFIRDHCFRAVLGASGQMGLIGLSFEPTSARRVPDIAGILWIDARTRQLRRLEYHYTRLPIDFDGRLPISYIEYARMPSGAWIVQRWAIRVPRVAGASGHAPTNPLAVADPARNRLVAVIEEGGEAFIGVRQASRATYVVEGTVFDSSAGKPLPGARVSLRGTTFNATADAAGRFRIQLPDTGSYMLVFDHARLDSLGFEVPSRGIRVAGSSTTADVAVPPLAVVRSALCPGSLAPDRTGIVHGTVRNSAGAAMSWATVKYRWAKYAVAPATPTSPLPADSSVPVSTSALSATFVTDSRGRYLVCDVPPGRYRLTLESEAGEVAETDVVAGAGELVLREMTLRRR